jgi:hypothetical protein
VRRRLKDDALKPWQHRSWIFTRDPDFRAKTARIMDLYARAFDGVPLGQDEYVISSDEKTSIQARCRCHPTLPPGQARAMRINHEYERGGALAYLAAYDVHRARVFGPNLDQVRDRLRAFEDRYNATARPVQWKFTTHDLDDLLARLDRHTLDRQEASAASAA